MGRRDACERACERANGEEVDKGLSGKDVMGICEVFTLELGNRVR